LNGKKAHPTPSTAQYFTTRSDYEQPPIAQTGRASAPRAASNLQRGQLLTCKLKSFLGRLCQQLQRSLAILVADLLHVPIRKPAFQRPRRMLYQHKQPPIPPFLSMAQFTSGEIHGTQTRNFSFFEFRFYFP
jgi:hypothetical protein